MRIRQKITWLAAIGVVLTGALAFALTLAKSGTTAADGWVQAASEMQQLGYHWVSCLPEDEEDESGDSWGCLLLACHDGSVEFGAAGLHLPRNGVLRLRFTDGEEVLTVTEDERTLDALGTAIDRIKTPSHVLDRLRAQTDFPLSNSGAELMFSMRNYSTALDETRRICSGG